MTDGGSLVGLVRALLCCFVFIFSLAVMTFVLMASIDVMVKLLNRFDKWLKERI